jgi:integrase
MASIGTDPNGHRRILFVAGDGKRKTIRLGKVSHSTAEKFKVKIAALIGSISTSVDDEVNRWLARLDDRMHRRIAAVGLVQPRAPKVEIPEGELTDDMIEPFIESYIVGRTDAKPNTIINLRQTKSKLVKYFSERKLLNDISEGDAEEWWRHLMGPKSGGGAGLSKNTARGHCKNAKLFLNFAISKRMIVDNPFAALESHVKGNKERQHIVARETTAKVTASCPDAQWRLIVALSRYGGLRCPSEHLALKWTDVDWDLARIRVPSPKTERYEGGESRMIPIFPELYEPLMEVYAAALEGADYVITRYRQHSSNLRTQLERIIRRAGVKQWPKLFHNLRATRQTELEQIYPSYVVCAWMGNNEKTARAHYLQVTDEHFEQAIKAAQNPAHQPCPTVSNGVQPTGDESAESPVFAGSSADFAELDIPPRGVEPLYSG